MGLKGPPLPSQLWLRAPWGPSIWGSPHFNLGYTPRQVTPSHVQGRPPGAEIILLSPLTWKLLLGEKL